MSVLRVIRDACPHCEAMRDVEVRRERETMKIRGEDVEFESEFMLCGTCSKDYADGVQMDYDLESARSIYRARHGIVDLTVNSYEQGVLPSGAHNSLLKLVSVPENFKSLYDANKASLSDRQRSKVECAMAALGIAGSADQVVREDQRPYGSSR